MSDEIMAIIYAPLNERSGNFSKFTFELLIHATEQFPESVLEVCKRLAVFDIMRLRK
jgi:hypothetical protein